MSEVVRDKATYYRAALLLGITNGDAVHAWASEVVAASPAPPAALIDLLLVPASDVSELRHTLYPLCNDPPTEAALHRVLNTIARAALSGERNLEDTVRVIDQLRRFERLPATLAESIATQVSTYDVAQTAPTDERTAVTTQVMTWLRSWCRINTTPSTTSHSGSR